MLSSDPKWQGEGKLMQAKRDDDYVSFYLTLNIYFHTLKLDCMYFQQY